MKKDFLRPKERCETDVGIEFFSNADGPLTKLDPKTAVSRYPGGPVIAEAALVRLLQLANKELAHETLGLIDGMENTHLIGIASRGVPALMESYFYTPLGLPYPDTKITTRPQTA